MVEKRRFDYDEGDHNNSNGQDSKRRSYTFNNDVRDIQRGLSLTEFVHRLEPFLRKVVKEEVELTIQSHLHSTSRATPDGGGPSGGTDLQLHFLNNLPATIFTNTRIEPEDRNPLQVILYDAGSQSIIQSGPLSSAKIEILVINGEFNFDDQDDWTEKEFNSSVVRERDGKRPLITGELTVTLKEGVGSVGEIAFTDNSSWIRCRKFRLGARIGQKLSGGLRIREARTEPFVVKDHRGEVYKKHHPPCLEDEIWRLERIAREGAFHRRLGSFGISTVRDFLQHYEINPLGLRNMLGGIAERIWDTIVEHANKCVIDDNKLYAYNDQVHGISLLFNSVYRVVGATFDGLTCCPVDNFDPFQKHLAEDLKLRAYKNVNSLVPVSDQSVLTGLSMPFPNPVGLCGGPSLSSEQVEYSDIHPEGSGLRKFNQWSLTTTGSTSHVEPVLHSSSDDIAWLLNPTSAPPLVNNAPWDQGNGFLIPSSYGTEVGFLPNFPLTGCMNAVRNGKGKGWLKVWVVVKCGISVRRDAKAKRAKTMAAEKMMMARSLYYSPY